MTLGVTFSTFRRKIAVRKIVTSGFAAITGVTITTGAIVRAKYQQETPNAEAQPAPSTNIQDFF